MKKFSVCVLTVLVISAGIAGIIFGIVNTITNTLPVPLELSQTTTSEILCPFNEDSYLVIENECTSRGCVWNPKKVPSCWAERPNCFLPESAKSGYYIETLEALPNGYTRLRLSLSEETPQLFPDMKKCLDVQLVEYGDTIIRIKISVPDEKRYEVPISLNLPSLETSLRSNSELNISFVTSGTEDQFAIRIWRKETGTLLFDSSIGGFIFADQFLQVSTRLPSRNLFGLGENSHYSFKHDLNYKTWPIFARDQGPHPGEYNLYGSHPMYLVMEDDGNSHGFFWLNSNALEVETLPSPGITLRSIGGIMDFFFFVGPSPSEVVRQYTTLIGKPVLPPYWALGFQLCRYGYRNVDDIEAAVLRTRRNGIPLDVQYADIDYMEDQKDFTIDQENFGTLPQLVKSEKEKGLKFIIILDPAINAELDKLSYPVHHRALARNVYIKWANDSLVPEYNFNSGGIMLGFVWPLNRTAFPDWFKSSTKDWWQEEIKRFYDTVKFDGLWIDMNEPANFGTNMKQPWNWDNDSEPWSLKCPTSRWDDPPYPTKAARINGNFRLSDKTICMAGVQGETGEFLHYDVHNLYGLSQTEPTFRALRNVTKKRGIVITRSTFPSSGKWSGHWLGDNTARWEDLRASITGMFEFNLFGIPYVGADICGFFGNSTEELCQRWMQLGAFYPFARNHNSKGYVNHDPGIWPSVARSSRESFRLRYFLLPYLYTLHYEASAYGDTVVRPLFFEFPYDEGLFSIDDQFLWGSALMIAPVVAKGSEFRSVYFPSGYWYDFQKGNLISKGAGRNISVTVPRSTSALFVRGGYVIPTQQPAANTYLSRKKNLGLIIAPDMDGRANGTLFWDDGESIDTVEQEKFYQAQFGFSERTLYWRIVNTYYHDVVNLTFSEVKIFNVIKRPYSILINGTRWTTGDFHYNPLTQVLEIFDLNISVTDDFTLTWTDSINFKIPCPIPYKGGYDDSLRPTRELCLQACVWNPSDDEVPCQFPSASQYGYRIQETRQNTEFGFKIPLTRIEGPSMFGDDVTDLEFEVIMYSDEMIRFKLLDARNRRFETPVRLNELREDIRSPQYEFINQNEKVGQPFSFKINRRESANTLLDTSIGGLTYSDQFLSVTFLLASKNVFGLGENNHGSFRHDLNSKTWAIFGRDQPPSPQEGSAMNLYGSQPFFQVQENDGNSYGVFMLSSNAIDYQMLNYPAITFRTIGGVLDFFVMLGPTPEAVVSQYTALVHRPFLPPYWALGFQICRYGYSNTNHIKNVLNRTRFYEIPQDVQYADIDYMDRRMDFTLDEKNFADLPKLFGELKDSGIRSVIILDPAINAEMAPEEYEVHKRAVVADVYIKWSNDTQAEVKTYNNFNQNDIVLGYVWPDNRTAFPNWFKNSTWSWWEKEILLFHNRTLKFDGLWIDMNEPAVFDTNMEQPWNWPPDRVSWNLKCPRNKWDDPPYVTKAASIGPSHRMSDKTLCLMALEEPYRHYDVHNMYGYMQTQPSLRAMQEATGERSIVISRSTFSGSGQWAGHWLGDNQAVWEDMHRSIIGMLEFNLFGIPYIGADICGFFGNTTEQLCQRWMQLGAFYPFSRNHNGKGYADQDPGMWPQVAKSSKRVLDIRYSLLPYLYTLFYQARIEGGTVVRPLHHEFPQDRKTYGVDTQFLWGPALMISPVLVQDAIARSVYFPMDFWYNFETGAPVEFPGEEITVDAPLEVIPLHIRGGHIIIKQLPATTTQQSRQNPLEMLVALGTDRTSRGTLFWDDGVSVETIEQEQFDLLTITYDQNTLTSTIKKDAGKMPPTLRLIGITIYGVENRPHNVTLLHSSRSNKGTAVLNPDIFKYEPKVLKLSFKVSLIMKQNFTIVFQGLWESHSELQK